MCEEKVKDFYNHLYRLGWSCKWLENDGMYQLANHSISFNISEEAYEDLVRQNQAVCKEQLEALFQKTAAPIQPAHIHPQHKPVGALERTDIEVTDEMRKHDEDIMNDENF